MAYNMIGGFPVQKLSFSKKNKVWRKKCVDFGDNYSLIHYHVTRKSVFNMKINYDLLNGKLHMEDLKLFLNPYSIDASFIPDNIQHYSIANAKLEVLRGEESDRFFDFKVVVTNPNAVSEIEKQKNQLINQQLWQMVADGAQSEDEFNQALTKMDDYFRFEYQDKREVRANRLLNHYMKEADIDQLFNQGFVDAYTVGEEAYFCNIVGGEPVLEKINPMKMRILRSGYSPYIEDADIIILEDYWSPGRVLEEFWDQLSDKDIQSIENAPVNMGSSYADSMDNIDDRYSFIPRIETDWVAGDAFIDPMQLFDDASDASLLPYDLNGNVRVLRVFWKSKKKIKKVKSYDPETGEEVFNFYGETYHCKPELGETEEVFWVNEAWEGTKIGDDIYVNMRPRPIQYNRLSNPSKCHFGIIGSIYNINGEEPYSLVDIMKPYSYLYDVIHDRLNKTLAKNMGKVVRMDFAKVPKGWDVDKWMYYMTVNGIAVENSWNEGDKGAATGVLAARLNNANSGVIDASLGNEIQQYITLLEWIATKIGEIAGISRQREGQVYNRETVGGVERATLQSSHSTKRLFFIHENVKKRVLECFLETAKIALKGRKKKFEYILEDGSMQIMDIDGDEFAECDYGLVVDNSNGAQELSQKMDTLAQAALQNQLLDFSTIMKLYTTSSIAEKQRMVEANEQRVREQNQQQQQQQLQLQQQQMEQQAQMEQQKQQLAYQMHQEDNETKVLVAQINASAENIRLSLMNHDNAEANDIEREKIAENAKQFEKKLAFDKEKLKADTEVKKQQIKQKSTQAKA